MNRLLTGIETQFADWVRIGYGWGLILAKSDGVKLSIRIGLNRIAILIQLRLVDKSSVFGLLEIGEIPAEFKTFLSGYVDQWVLFLWLELDFHDNCWPFLNFRLYDSVIVKRADLFGCLLLLFPAVDYHGYDD